MPLLEGRAEGQVQGQAQRHLSRVGNGTAVATTRAAPLHASDAQPACSLGATFATDPHAPHQVALCRKKLEQRRHRRLRSVRVRRAWPKTDNRPRRAAAAPWMKVACDHLSALAVSLSRALLAALLREPLNVLNIEVLR